MSEVKAFLSYVHADDETEGSRIVQLGQDIAAQYAMITGEEIHLFIDKDRNEGISWGEEWRQVIDNSIATVAFFIPVLTQRYFMSPECRRELQLFLSKAEQIGIQDLLLPVYYSDITDFSLEDTGDDLKDTIKKFQWVEWRELKFETRDSGVYRREVYNLAQRLVQANAVIDESLSSDSLDLAEAKGGGIVVSDDDTPGTLDMVASVEKTIPKMNKAMQGIGTELKELAKFITGRIPELNRVKNSTVQAKLRVLKKFANDMLPYAEKVDVQGQKYTKSLYETDQIISALNTMLVAAFNSEGISDKDRHAIIHYAKTVVELDDASERNVKSVAELSEQLKPLEAASRDMRHPLKFIRKAITSVFEGADIIAGWANQVRAIAELEE